MSYKLQIVDSNKALNFSVRYDNLAKAKRPAVESKNSKGDPVRYVTTYKGGILPTGSTKREWMDDSGNPYAKTELTHWIGDEEVSEIDQTKVFNVDGFQPVKHYTDNYVISAYYEIYPDDNGLKKDIDKERARAANLSQMHKLWQHLDSNKVVARGEFCPASRGFIASDGYIRAIRIDGTKWALEVGVFKEEKVFKHLQEGVPSDAVLASPVEKKGKRLKLV